MSIQCNAAAVLTMSFSDPQSDGTVDLAETSFHGGTYPSTSSRLEARASMSSDAPRLRRRMMEVRGSASSGLVTKTSSPPMSGRATRNGTSERGSKVVLCIDTPAFNTQDCHAGQAQPFSNESTSDLPWEATYERASIQQLECRSGLFPSWGNLQSSGRHQLIQCKELQDLKGLLTLPDGFWYPKGWIPSG